MDLVFNNFTKSKSFTTGFFKKILDHASKELGLKYQVGLSVNLVGREKIKFLNKKYRSQNKTTDVLSFPLHNSVLPNKTKETILELGDIFICLDVAVQKAKKNKTKLAHEMKFLTVHGFLHLLGYDHEKSKAGEKKMFTLQNKILKKL